MKTPSSPQKRKLQCICGSTFRQAYNTKPCSECNTLQHPECIGSLLKMKRYVCPQCQLKQIDPFLKHRLNFHISLIKTIENKSESTHEFRFFLNKDQLTKLTSNSFLIIRSLLLNEKGFKLEWTNYFRLELNKKKITYALNSKKWLTKSHNSPFVFAFDETYKDNINKTNEKYFPYDKQIFSFKEYFNIGLNLIKMIIRYDKEDPDINSYALSVDLVELFQNTDAVIKHLPRVHTISESQRYIQFEDGVDKEKINLYDHYTLSERIVLPGRGVACNHLGVFDVKRFLIVNIHIRKYTCPICMKYANKCYIDEVMKNIFEKEEYKNCNCLVMDYNYNVHIKGEDNKELFVNGSDDDNEECGDDVNEFNSVEYISLKDSEEQICLEKDNGNKNEDDNDNDKDDNINEFVEINNNENVHDGFDEEECIEGGVQKNDSGDDIIKVRDCVSKENENGNKNKHSDNNNNDIINLMSMFTPILIDNKRIIDDDIECTCKCQCDNVNVFTKENISDLLNTDNNTCIYNNQLSLFQTTLTTTANANTTNIINNIIDKHITNSKYNYISLFNKHLNNNNNNE